MSRIVALCPDLFFSSKIAETLGSAGHSVEIVATAAAATAAAPTADLVVCDLHAEGLDPAALVGALGGTPALGFFSHVDAEARGRAEDAGFDLVVPRSRMAREMPELVARLAD
jgi:CheY-like chemotaxis protein